MYSPKSADKNHYIHAWNGSTNNGEWLYASRCEGDEVIPASKCFYEFTDPSNSFFDPTRMNEWYNNETERSNRKKYRECFRESFQKKFESLFHSYKDIELQLKCKGEARDSEGKLLTFIILIYYISNYIQQLCHSLSKRGKMPRKSRINQNFLDLSSLYRSRHDESLHIINQKEYSIL